MPRNRRRKKSITAPAKIIGDPNTAYDKSENIEGPGREPASVGFGNANFPDKFHFSLRFPHNAKAGDGRMMSSAWNSAYAARKYLEFVMDGEEVDWTALNKFITHHGVEVSCMAPSDRLEENVIEEALNHKFTKAEEAFVIPQKDRDAFIRMVRPYPDVEKPGSTGKAKIDRKGPNKPDGKYISVAQIAEEAGVEPRDARASLRKAKFEKPDWGWSFKAGSDDLKKATSIIKKGAR